MTESKVQTRHLAVEGLREFLEKGVKTGFLLEGKPTAYIDIDVPGDILTLRIQGQSSNLQVLSEFRNLQADNIYLAGEYWTAIRTVGPGRILDAYPVFCAIADQVQLCHFGVGDAVLDVLSRYRDLLASTQRISDEKEIGLFGELLTLEALLAVLKPEKALEAWRGPLSEEHDFGLLNQDIEVKTTISERRIHWIGSVEQLQSTEPRSLWLLSLQLTLSGNAGRTLPEIIGCIRASLPNRTAQDRFRQYLEANHWNEELRDLFRRRFQLRTTPAMYRVDQTFPTLTVEMLREAGIDFSFVRQIKYQIDLTGLVANSNLPPELALLIGGFAK